MNGDFKENYFGGRTLGALRDFAQSQIGKPSFKLIEAAELPKVYEEHQAALVFAFDGSKEETTKPLVATMHSVAKAIKGKIPVFFCPENKCIENANVEHDSAALVIFRDRGIDQAIYQSQLTSVDDIEKWVLNNKDPLV